MESFFTNLVDQTVGSFGRRVRYLRDYNRNIADLRNKLQVLNESREAVEDRVNDAKRNGEVITPEVEKWLARVGRVIKDYGELLDHEEFEENRFIDLKSRYKVSKKAKEGILLADGLQRECKFNRVCDPAPPPALTYDFTLTGAFEVFESRRPTYEAIIKALQGDEISIIGVYGMAGVGKTTLVREIAKYAEFNHLFDEIVMAVVSPTSNIREIQGEIADALGLQLYEETLCVRADRLYAKIKDVKKILVILDDLWTAIDLEDIGIRHGDAHEGCKIVLISRELDVCHQMNAQTSNCIQVLSESEAWTLFEKTAGNIEELPEVLPVAREVAKECGGLPFTILSVAKALRGKNDIVWKDILSKLKKLEGLHDHISRFLKLSYELLETEELKTYDFTLMRDLGVFESRRPTYEAIIKALQGDEISIIGVYGMAGVGKTTLVREIAKYAEFNHLFDEIVMAVVSPTSNIRKIQGEIADALGLQFDVESDYGRAGCLYARIKNAKRILVILDDLWTAIDLEDIGIPHGDAHEGCKILLVSRELDVCHQMNAQTTNCIQVLSESEAWTLFEKTAGNIEELPEVLPVAREVAKECGGLPFAILSVAGALRGKNDIVWKDALSKLKKSEGLHDHISRFLKLSYELLETEELKTYDFTLMRDLGVFESRRPTYEAIIKALQGDEISMIGVYGMAGVGKTTLVREIAKYAEFNHLFDEIVMAVVSPTSNIRKIQGEIADALGLQFDVESDYGRAGCLYARIKNVKRILVILDDLRTALALEAVGIPHGDAHEGCKIVLTSRELDVCHQMNAQTSNCIQVLSESEAWILFEKTASNIEELPDVLPVAQKVAKECGGLPVAIISVAKALRGKNDIVWKDALSKLKKSEGLHDNISRSLKLSYELLETEELKTCFLLCCLFPEDSDIPIEYLVRYGIGLRWYQNVDSLIEARFSAHTMIDELKACGLLLDGIDKGSTRMHDVVREFAISMASGGEHAFLVGAGSGEAEWPKVEALGQYRVISLIGNCIQKFPHYGLDCPNLEMLVLQCDSDSVEMPHNFFKGMKNLGVLHLRRMSIPNSIGHLKKLRMLCLECCKIPDDLREMEELENLEILSIVDCDIEELPRAIGKIFKLRLLDLAYCKKLRVIRPGILVRLTNLEGLYMRNSFKDWAGYDQDDNASLTELKDLSSLEVLEMHIPDAKLYPKDLLLDTLTQFKITIGGDFDGHDIYSYSKNLKLENCGSVALEGGGVNMLLRKAESVVLKDLKIDQNVLFDLTHHDFGNLKVVAVFDCDKLKSLFRHIRGRGLGQLHGLDVRSCSNMEAILVEDGGAVAQEDEIIFPELKSMKLMSLPNLMSFLDAHLHEPLFHRKVLFPALEELYLWGLDNMKEIWHRELLPAQSFDRLSDLSIGSCGKLITVIPSNLSRRLNILAKFSVWDCDSVEEICEGHDATSSILPQISILRLWGLPKLEHIWWNKVSHSFISLKNIKILRIYRCKVLRFVFSVSTSKDLGQLEILAIGKCDMMKAIVADEGRDTIEAVNRIVFPKLHTLELKYMEQLTGFYQGDCTLVFDSLEILRIEKCPLIKTFTENPKEASAPPQPFGGEQRLIAPKLHNIKLGGLTDLQKSHLHSTAQHSTKEGKPVGGEGKEKEGKVTAPQFHSEIVEDKA